MIKTVAEEVGKLSPEHKVDLKNAERTVLIELYRVNLALWKLLTIAYDWS